MTEPTRGMPLYTDTRHVRLETRQYRVFKLDLGDGIRRVALKVGAAVCLPWWLLCATLGVPFLDWSPVWLIPPIMLTARGISRDAGGRLRLRGWADAVQWLGRRRSRVVNGQDTRGRGPQPIVTAVAFTTVDPGLFTARDVQRLLDPEVAETIRVAEAPNRRLIRTGDHQ